MALAKAAKRHGAAAADSVVDERLRMMLRRNTDADTPPVHYFAAKLSEKYLMLLSEFSISQLLSNHLATLNGRAFTKFLPFTKHIMLGTYGNAQIPANSNLFPDTRHRERFCFSFQPKKR